MFTKSHEEINVCSLWVICMVLYLEKELFFFNSGKLITLAESCTYDTVLLCFRHPDSVTQC